MGGEIKTITNDNQKLYIAILNFDSDELEVTFPARADLILGLSLSSLVKQLMLKICFSGISSSTDSFSIVTSVPNPFSGNIMLTQRPDLWEEVLDSSFIAADSKIYYTKDDTGFRPVDPYKEPEANLNNILILKDQSQLSSIKAKVKVKRYKQKFDEVTLGFPELISDLSDEGSLFLVYEESYGKKIVNIFFVNTLLNYFHLYSFEVDDFSITALQNKTLKGWLYAYVRIDNLLMIDKEFDSERKLKWRVPIGD